MYMCEGAWGVRSDEKCEEYGGGSEKNGNALSVRMNEMRESSDEKVKTATSWMKRAS